MPDATFDDLCALASAEIEPVLVRVRELVLDVHPEAVEATQLGYQSQAFGTGPKRTESYAYAKVNKAHVNLGFMDGAALPDPEGLLEGTGKSLRHVKLRSVEEVERPAVRALVEAAVARHRDGAAV